MLRVEFERKTKGISQAKLARLADVNTASMNRIERGKEPAYPHRGKRIADALGWKGDPMKLFEEVGEDEQHSAA
jgi:DNA-binding helix-turn-helix protein